MAMGRLRVIIGPPCSGKSTYVAENRAPDEVVIDLDLLAQALGSEIEHGSDGDIRSAAIAARHGAIDRVIEESLSAWVTHCNPSDEQIAAYEDAGAELIYMDTDLETCLARAEADGRPPIDFALIREWFDEHGDEEEKDEQRSSQVPQGAILLRKEAEMPYRPQEREYRTFAASNFRALENNEDDKPSYRVRGYFTTFNDEYLLYARSKYWPAEFEQIDPHAFDDCDMSDVIFQFDHQGMVLSRQRNNTLTLGIDDHGAWCEAFLGGCEQGRNLFEAIQNGLVDEMSFAFAIYSGEDGEGYTTFKDEEGDYHTTITRISKCFDVSAVSIPANPGTEIDEMRKRSYLAATIEADRKKAEEDALAEEEQRAADSAAIRRRKAKALELKGIQHGYTPE